MGYSKAEQILIDVDSECCEEFIEFRVQIRPRLPDDGCRYRRLGTLCAATLVTDNSSKRQQLLELSSMNYDACVYGSETSFALGLA